MTQQIDNFIITDTGSRIVVDYIKPAKDKFDTFFTLTFGLLISGATYFLFREGIRTTNHVVIAAAIVSAFQAVVQIFSGLARLLQPKNNILTIDKTANKLKSRHSPSSSKSFSLDEVQTLVVCGQNEHTSVGDGQKMTRTYCTISATLKDKPEERLFTINTNRFFRSPKQEIETQLYTKAKRLTIKINRHLKSKYQWTVYDDNQKNRHSNVDEKRKPTA